MKDILIGSDDIRAIHPVFRSGCGNLLIKIGTKVAGLKYANRIYDASKHLTGSDFCTDVLDKLNVKRIVKNGDILHEYQDRPFITLSNHPLGHLDGVSLIETVASRTHHYKVLVNSFLGLVDTLSDNFINVNPHKANSTTLNGIKESLQHLASGKPLGFFPAGAISFVRCENGKFRIKDREWQASVLKIIQRANVPVIPIHVDGRNSRLFYGLEIFGWQVRTLRLCHEFYNKKGKTLTLTIGNPITPEEIAQFSDISTLGRFLQDETYKLK